MVIRKNSYSMPGAHDGLQSMHIDEDQTDAEYWRASLDLIQLIVGVLATAAYILVYGKNLTLIELAQKIPLTKQASQMLGRKNSQVKRTGVRWLRVTNFEKTPKRHKEPVF